MSKKEQEKKELQEKARTDAVREAKEKAQSLADAAGIKLGRIVDVQESSFGEPIPMRAFALDSGKEQIEPTNLTPGENTVSITITLSYETY